MLTIYTPACCLKNGSSCFTDVRSDPVGPPEADCTTATGRSVAGNPITFATMNDEHFMKQALQQAQRAFNEDEVPVGAVIVLQNKIIARGYNQVEKLGDCTAHAEMIALTSAFHLMGAKYLPEASIYVTVEPCVMCAGALYWSQVGRIVYGAADEKNGYKRVTGNTSPFHKKANVIAQFMQEECGALMKAFFAQKRK